MSELSTMELELGTETIARLAGLEKTLGLDSPDAVINFLLDARQRNIEGGRKGGFAPKTFTPESKQRQIEGAQRGGSAAKHFSPEGKRRQVEGAVRGGRNSRKNSQGTWE